MLLLQFFTAITVGLGLLFYIDHLLWYKEQYFRDKKFKLISQLTPEFIRNLTEKLEIQADSKQEAEGFVKVCIEDTINQKGKPCKKNN